MGTDNRIPDFAVIIPARNEAPRIGGCLDSVRQALECAAGPDAEVIVVDDDSTDETSDIARAHGALALRQSPRRGPLAAWAHGVAHSSASLLFFVDADCRVDERAFSALLRGFARPAVGVVAARSEPSGRTLNSLVERSATFSALMIHETRIRLVNHDFLPIGRLMAVRRAAWQTDGDHKWPCDRIVASRAKRAGWEIRYMPEAVVYYQPIGTYDELRSDYLRTAVAQAHILGDWAEPLPRGIVCRAASASLRRQPLNAAAWLALRARLWSERSVGLMRPEEAYAHWDRLPHSSPSSSRPGPSHQAREEPAGRSA